jgi:putative IMPACT (imprinted ancient) family translation regulator
MIEYYKAVYVGGEGELVEKKSRFIATVIPIQTQEDAICIY